MKSIVLMLLLGVVSLGLWAAGDSQTAGKKHACGMFKSVLNEQKAGDSYGYEFHAKDGKSHTLNKVGFYFKNGDKQMSKMRFGVNVYDMSNVKGNMSSAFVKVNEAPLEFEYVLGSEDKGKYEYVLPNSVKLPKDAMVEIVFLEDMGDQILWYKSNLVGKWSWGKSATDKEWVKSPFAGPFFVEVSE